MEDTSREESVDLRFYLGVLRRRGWVIVLTTVLAGLAAFGASLLQTKVYDARADVLIGRQASDQVFTANGQYFDPKRNVETEVKVLESQAVSDAAAKELGHAPDVTISSDEVSDVVSVHARSDDPKRAAVDADAYAQAYVDYRFESTVGALLSAGQEVQTKIDDLDARLAMLPANSAERNALEAQRAYLVEQLGRLEVSANLTNAGGAAVLAKAEVPSTPVSPKPLRNGLLGAVLGFFLGIGLAFLLEHFDDTIKERAGLEHALAGAVPVIGEIPEVAGSKKPKAGALLVVADEPTSTAAEAYRMLRTSVTFLGLDKRLRSILITSAAESEGKSTVTANLAVTLARAGKKVIVVDLDLRRPRIHEIFGVSNMVGLTSVLLDESSLTEAIQRVPQAEQLAVLTCGKSPPNPSELLASPRVAEIIALLADVADVVVIDSPPVLPVADSLTIAGFVDGTILVARDGSSSRRAVHRAVELMNQVDAPLVGAVINDVDMDSAGYGYGRYAYDRRPKNDQKKKDQRPKPVEPKSGVGADAPAFTFDTPPRRPTVAREG